MKNTIQFWKLPELFNEVFRRAGAEEDIYLIAYSAKFRNSHFPILKALIEAINNKRYDGEIQQITSS